MSKDIVVGVFIWNLEKERINVAQHGLSFDEAREAFIDPRRLITVDSAHSQKEERWFCIGLINGKVATVRFTSRDKSIRIIGAGYWRKGRKVYEEKENR